MVSLRAVDSQSLNLTREEICERLTFHEGPTDRETQDVAL